MLERRRLRIIGFYAQAVFFLSALPDVIGFREQAAGVERGEGNVEPGRGDQMGDDLILEAEAGGEDDAAGQSSAQGRKPLGGIEGGGARVQGKGDGAGLGSGHG